MAFKVMREAIHALTEELRRLRGLGVKHFPVSDESIRALRSAVTARQGASAPVATTEEEAPAVAPARSLTDVRPIAAKEPKPVRTTLPPPPVVSLPEGTKAERWAALRELVLQDPVCRAHVRVDKKVVFGVGALDARVFFCGEAPGAEEEVQGEPFVGPAGEKLTAIIKAMGLARETVYIGNIMNWRPQLGSPTDAVQVGNRPPTDEELAYCLPYLQAQIEIVDPVVIVGLGGTAAKGLLGPQSFRTVGEVRSRWHSFRGRPLMITYHPSYLLRQVGDVAERRAKRAMWEDMMLVMEKLDMPISDKQRAYFSKS